jgi:hypothetical protein
MPASFFTGDQLRMLADFVSRRGGGLIVLGGRGSLAEGGFSGTPLAEVLPVGLEAMTPVGETDPATELKVRVTPPGLVHPALQLGPTEAAGARWDSLPPLTSVNHLGALKPGATALLVGRPAGGGPEVPVLAVQRFGKGTVALLGVQDTWLWQMNADIPLEDQTHEMLWKQLIRWSLAGVPDRLEIAASPSRVGPGEAVVLQARVSDQAFLEANDAVVSAKVTSPSGRTFDVPLAWTLKEDGVYQGRFVTEEAGMYQVEAEARRGADTVHAAPAALLADDQGADVEQAELRSPLLKRISGETGGRYYTLSDAGKLTEDVEFTNSGVTVRESRDLWDMPALFLLLVTLLGAEWGYRRLRGLA